MLGDIERAYPGWLSNRMTHFVYLDHLRGREENGASPGVRLFLAEYRGFLDGGLRSVYLIMSVRLIYNRIYGIMLVTKDCTTKTA